MDEAGETPEQALARCEAELREARRRYDALRSRKAVGLALAVAGMRHRARRRPAASPEPPGVAVASPQPAPRGAASAKPPGAGAAGTGAASPQPAPPRADAGREPAPTAGAAPQPAPPPAGTVQHCWPMGHFYSPVPDTVALSQPAERDRVWPATPPETPGIDWRDEAQVALVRELATQGDPDFAPAATGDPTEYHTSNEMFSRLDAWALQAMLRHLRPARMIEIGSGWSSLVAARVNREQLGGALDLTCVEPYPAEFLKPGVPGISRLLPTPVQDVPLATFAQLGDRDVLFIDSSHVAKTGSDCNYLYQDVLPRLRSGVVVHVHDIFLPFDYPQQWVFDGRGWNEQYVLRAFLSFNDAFEILLGNVWMSHRHPDVLAEAITGFPESAPDGGGSLWLRRR